MPAVSLPEWQSFLDRHPEAHLLQASEWGALKSGFGWSVERLVAGQAGAQLLFRRIPLGLCIAYLPRGPLGEPGAEFWSEIEHLCRRKHAIFLKIEPDLWETDPSAQTLLLPAGFKPSLHNIQPPRTLLVDLSGSEEQVLARMKQKCRYNLRLAGKKGITVRPWEDIDAFHRMLLVTGDRDAFGVHSLEYYRRAYQLLHPAGLAELLVAEYEGQPLAALMVACRGTRAWYLYGASTDQERSRMPTYLLQWEAMRWARAHGALEYDLWGVPDEEEPALESAFESRHDGLWGVYRFKRGFGGQLRRSLQAQDKVFNPLLYKLYLRRMAGRENG
jgi:peptidoglycan pentaglycine glycine transferase (the first glycine)